MFFACTVLSSELPASLLDSKSSRKTCFPASELSISSKQRRQTRLSSDLGCFSSFLNHIAVQQFEGNINHVTVK